MGVVCQSVGMAKTFKLNKPELADELERRLSEGGSGRDLKRLTALRLGMLGTHTLDQIATIVGQARSTICNWMKLARAEGIAALLALHQGKGAVPQVKGKVFSQLRKGLVRGRWKRSKEVREWLEERHGIRMGLTGARYWLKKAGES